MSVQKSYSKTSLRPPDYSKFESLVPRYNGILEDLKKRFVKILNSPDWVREEEGKSLPKGLKIFSLSFPDENTSHKAGLGVINISCENTNPFEFLQFINRVKFSYNGTFRKYHQKLHQRYIFYQSLFRFDKNRSDLVHFRWSSPSKLFLQDRDYVILRRWRYYPEKKLAMIWGESLENSQTFKIYPMEKSCTRAKLTFAWVIKQKSKNVLTIQCFTRSIISGYVPSYFFNSSVNDKSKRVHNYCKAFLEYRETKEGKKDLLSSNNDQVSIRKSRNLERKDEKSFKKKKSEEEKEEEEEAEGEEDVEEKLENEKEKIRKSIEQEFKDRVEELTEEIDDLQNRNKHFSHHYHINESDLEPVKRLGRGGMGVVDMCRWNGIGGGIKVAVKTIRVQSRRIDMLYEVEKEFQTMILLHHPNILRIFGVCSNIKQFYVKIVMEVMDYDLHDFIVARNKEKRYLSVYDKFKIMKKMTRACHYLHTKNILHRDLKSYNFMTSNDGKDVKICDFGHSKVLVESAPTVMSVYHRGTPAFKPPEQIPVHLLSEEVPYTKYGDIYMLAMCFYEILVERDPFFDYKYTTKRPENQIYEILREIRKGLRPSLSFKRRKKKKEEEKQGEEEEDGEIFIPKELMELFDKLWNEEPKERGDSSSLLKWFSDHKEKFKKEYSNVFVYPENSKK